MNIVEIENEKFKLEVSTLGAEIQNFIKKDDEGRKYLSRKSRLMHGFEHRA